MLSLICVFFFKSMFVIWEWPMIAINLIVVWSCSVYCRRMWELEHKIFIKSWLMKHLWWPSSSHHFAPLKNFLSVRQNRFWMEWPGKIHPNKVNIINYGNILLTHKKIGFWCWLAIVLLNIFGFVGDHPDERVELNDGYA